MIKLKTHLIVMILFCCVFGHFRTDVYAQNSSEENYYLVKNLPIENMSAAEKKLIDSSLTLYHQAANDTLKINAINIIVEESWNDFVWPKYNKWVYDYIEEKLKDKKLQRKRNEATLTFLLKNKSGALNNFGVWNYSKGNYEKAIKNYSESLSIKEGINDYKGIASIYNNLGGIYDNKGNSPKALEYYLKALKIRESDLVNDPKGLSISLNNVGQSYFNQGETQKALQYFEKSLEVNANAKSSYSNAAILNNIGVIYSLENKYDKALEYFKQSLAIKETIGDKKGIVVSLNSIGRLLKDQGKYQEAEVSYNKSLNLSKEIENKEGLAISLNNLADIFYEKDQYKTAEKYSKQSMTLAQELRKPLLISDAALSLFKVYKEENKWKDALHMHELHILMRDSINNKETEKDVIRQKALYDLEKKENELALLATQNEVNELKLKEKSTMVYFMTSAFIFTLLLAIAIYYGNQKKQIINELLKQQKEEISLKNEEKAMMLKEIHHRVKNSMHAINSLLRFQSRSVEDPKTLAMFKTAQKRVMSMALLHEKMYLSEDVKHIDIKEHTSSLIKDLIDNYAIDKKIVLKLNIEELKFGLKTLTPLSLIISEIITNSLKYAFPNSTNGEIFVSLKNNTKNKYELFISDNGIGYNPEEKHEGLGSKLIQMYTKQLNGAMTRLSNPSTSYKLTFSIAN